MLDIDFFSIPSDGAATQKAAGALPVAPTPVIGGRIPLTAESLKMLETQGQTAALKLRGKKPGDDSSSSDDKKKPKKDKKKAKKPRKDSPPSSSDRGAGTNPAVTAP